LSEVSTKTEQKGLKAKVSTFKKRIRREEKSPLKNKKKLFG
jgi:hypothetical protein